MVTKGARESKRRERMEKLGLWVEELEALVPAAVWGQLPTTACVSKGRRDLDSGHSENNALLHNMSLT